MRSCGCTCTRVLVLHSAAGEDGRRKLRARSICLGVRFTTRRAAREDKFGPNVKDLIAHWEFGLSRGAGQYNTK